MKRLLAIITLFSIINAFTTNYCMESEKAQQPATILPFTKTIHEDSCNDLLVDIGTSCCLGVTAECTLHHIFPGSIAICPLTCSIVTLVSFAATFLKIYHAETDTHEKKAS